MDNNLKILKAEVKNFKNLKSKEVDIDGNSLMIIGANGEGKSSFLQALMVPFLDTYKPIEPITQGEERGSVSVKIGGELEGEEVEYLVEMYFSQENQKGRLKITDKEGGNVKSPKSILDSIIGDISFDIDRFLQLAKTPSGKNSKEGAKRQVEMLKEFLPIEVQKSLQRCDIERKDVVSERTEVRSRIRFMEQENEHDFSDEELEKYKDGPKSEEEVDNKMSTIGKQIESWEENSKTVESLKEQYKKHLAVFERKDEYKEKIDIVGEAISGLEKYRNQQDTATFLVALHKYKSEKEDLYEEAMDAEKLMPKVLDRIEKGEKWLKDNPRPTMDAILKEKKEIQEFNEKAREIQKMMSNHKRIIEKKKEDDALTQKIKAIDERKKQIFIENPLPVKGLTFDEDQVKYKDLPFNEETHPRSTIIGVGVKIAMAMNPNLKVIVIKDGSLLDKELFNKILTMVEANNFQLFIEMVDWNRSDLEIKFAEKQA